MKFTVELIGLVFSFGLGYNFCLELLVSREGLSIEGGALFEKLENVDAH